MASKSGKYLDDFDLDPYDDYEEYDEDVEIEELAKDFFSSDDSDDWYVKEERISARRKIERRRERKALYSELDDWEQYGERSDF